MYVEMKVKFLTFDSTSNGFVVLLMDLSNKTGLPIWIGPFEANAIAMKLKKMGSHRPSTHDLINNILKTLQSQVVKIVVNDLRGKYLLCVDLPQSKRRRDHHRLPSQRCHRHRLGCGCPNFCLRTSHRKSANHRYGQRGRPTKGMAGKSQSR